MAGPTNEDRVASAQQAVDAFAAATNMENEPLEIVVVDLLSNLMHLCDAEEKDFGWLLGIATMHREAEVEEV